MKADRPFPKEEELKTKSAWLAQLKTHIINYSKTRDVYAAYKKSRHKKEFRAEHADEIGKHEAAKAAFDALAAKGKVWQKNTLITLLDRLINKGFLKAKKTGRRNEYTPLVSETEYQTAQTKNFLDKIYEGRAKGLISNLIQSDLLEADEYEDLRRLLEGGTQSNE